MKDREFYAHLSVIRHRNADDVRRDAALYPEEARAGGVVAYLRCLPPIVICFTMLGELLVAAPFAPPGQK